MLNSKRLTSRLTALFLCLSFTLLNVTINPFTSAAQPASLRAHPFAIPTPDLLSSISIPEVFGTIQETFQGDGQHLVIYIQTAHANFDSETATAKMVNDLQRRYGLRLVMLEGGEGKLDTLFFQAFPDAEMKETVLSDYVRAGVLSGGEVAAILNEDPAASFYGIEYQPLYDANRAEFLEAMSKKAEIEETLKARALELEAKAEEALSAEALAFLKNWRAFHRNQMDLLEYLNTLRQFFTTQVHSGKIPSVSGSKEESAGEGEMVCGEDIQTACGHDPYPELQKLFAEIEHDQTEDRDPSSFMTPLVAAFETRVLPKLTQHEKVTFGKELQAYKTGEVAAGTLLLKMERAAETAGASMQVPGELKSLAERTRTMSSLKGTTLFAELKAFEADVRAAFGSQLLDAFFELGILSDFAKLEIVHTEWQWLKTHSFDLAPMFVPHFRFYHLAEQRDTALFENMMSLMDHEQSNVSILVTGGFHAEGVKEKLRKTGTSYVLIAPKIDTLGDREVYLDAMQGDFAYMKYYHGSLWEALAQDYARKVAARVPPMDLGSALKHWRDRIIQNAMAEGRITEAHQFTIYVDAMVRALGEEKDGAEPGSERHEDVTGEVKRLIQSFSNLYFDQIKTIVDHEAESGAGRVRSFWNSERAGQTGTSGIAAALKVIRNQGLGFGVQPGDRFSDGRAEMRRPGADTEIIEYFGTNPDRVRYDSAFVMQALTRMSDETVKMLEGQKQTRGLAEYFRRYHQNILHAADYFVKDSYYKSNVNNAIIETMEAFSPVVSVDQIESMSPEDMDVFLNEYMDQMRRLFDFILSASEQGQTAAQAFVRRIGHMSAVIHLPLYLDAQHEFPYTWDARRVMDLASGPGILHFVPSMDHEVEHILVDRDLQGYLSALLEMFGFLFPGKQIDLIRADIRSRFYSEPSSLDVLRAKNVGAYVHLTDAEWERMIEWIKPGGELILATDRNIEAQHLTILDTFRQMGPKMISEGWEMQYDLDDDASAFDSITFVKPGAGLSVEAGKSWSDYERAVRRAYEGRISKKFRHVVSAVRGAWTRSELRSEFSPDTIEEALQNVLELSTQDLMDWALSDPDQIVLADLFSDVFLRNIIALVAGDLETLEILEEWQQGDQLEPYFDEGQNLASVLLTNVLYSIALSHADERSVLVRLSSVLGELPPSNDAVLQARMLEIKEEIATLSGGEFRMDETQHQLWERQYATSLRPDGRKWEKPQFIMDREVFNAVSYMGIPENEVTLLDLGSGNGDGGSFGLASHGFKNTIHVDFSHEALQQFQSRLNAAGIQGDLREGDLLDQLKQIPDASAHIVHAHLSLHYFPFEKTAALFEEIKRVLRPDGVFIFKVFSTQDARDQSKWMKLDDRGNFYRDQGGKTMRLFSASDIEGFLEASGFQSHNKKTIVVEGFPNQPWVVEAYPVPRPELRKDHFRFSSRFLKHLMQIQKKFLLTDEDLTPQEKRRLLIYLRRFTQTLAAYPNFQPVNRAMLELIHDSVAREMENLNAADFRARYPVYLEFLTYVLHSQAWLSPTKNSSIVSERGPLQRADTTPSYERSDLVPAEVEAMLMNMLGIRKPQADGVLWRSDHTLAAAFAHLILQTAKRGGRPIYLSQSLPKNFLDALDHYGSIQSAGFSFVKGETDTPDMEDLAGRHYQTIVVDQTAVADFPGFLKRLIEWNSKQPNDQKIKNLVVYATEPMTDLLEDWHAALYRSDIELFAFFDLRNVASQFLASMPPVAFLANFSGTDRGEGFMEHMKALRSTSGNIDSLTNWYLMLTLGLLSSDALDLEVAPDTMPERSSLVRLQELPEKYADLDRAFSEMSSADLMVQYATNRIRAQIREHLSFLNRAPVTANRITEYASEFIRADQRYRVFLKYLAYLQAREPADSKRLVPESVEEMTNGFLQPVQGLSGKPLPQTTLLFSNGMAALQTLFEFLSGQNQGQPASILLGRNVYFETRPMAEQISNVKFTSVYERDVDSILRAVQPGEVQALVLEPVSNAVNFASPDVRNDDLPVLDFKSLVSGLMQKDYPKPFYLILDVTLFGNTFQLADFMGDLSLPQNLHIILSSSLQKMNQDGLELTADGAVTVISSGLPEHESLIQKLRETRDLMGFTPSRYNYAAMNVFRNGTQITDRSRHLFRNSEALAKRLHQIVQETGPEVEVIHPSLASHPDHSVWLDNGAQGVPFFILRFEDPGMSTGFFQEWVEKATQAGLPFHFRSSFGFNGLTYTFYTSKVVRINPGFLTDETMRIIADTFRATLDEKIGAARSEMRSLSLQPNWWERPVPNRSFIDAKVVVDHLTEIGEHLGELNERLSTYYYIGDFAGDLLRNYSAAIDDFNASLNRPMTLQLLEEKFRMWASILNGRQFMGGINYDVQVTQEMVIEVLMQLFSEKTNVRLNEDRRAAFDLAAELFYDLHKLEPFPSPNGGNHRTINLVVNYILIKNGFAPFYLDDQNIVEYRGLRRLIRRTATPRSEAIEQIRAFFVKNLKTRSELRELLDGTETRDFIGTDVERGIKFDLIEAIATATIEEMVNGNSLLSGLRDRLLPGAYVRSSDVSVSEMVSALKQLGVSESDVANQMNPLIIKNANLFLNRLRQAQDRRLNDRNFLVRGVDSILNWAGLAAQTFPSFQNVFDAFTEATGLITMDVPGDQEIRDFAESVQRMVQMNITVTNGGTLRPIVTHITEADMSAVDGMARHVLSYQQEALIETTALQFRTPADEDGYVENGLRAMMNYALANPKFQFRVVAKDLNSFRLMKKIMAQKVYENGKIRVPAGQIQIVEAGDLTRESNPAAFFIGSYEEMQQLPKKRTDMMGLDTARFAEGEIDHGKVGFEYFISGAAVKLSQKMIEGLVSEDEKWFQFVNESALGHFGLLAQAIALEARAQLAVSRAA